MTEKEEFVLSGVGNFYKAERDGVVYHFVKTIGFYDEIEELEVNQTAIYNRLRNEENITKYGIDSSAPEEY